VTDLDFALNLAKAADEIALARFRAVDLSVQTKPDRTPVTDADQAVERALRELIAAERPGDSVIGEEFGSDESSNRQWIIDPIDGTANFLRGIPIWGTLIALRIDGDHALSVVSAPALGRRWWAASGSGAFTEDLDGTIRQIRVSVVKELADAYVSYNSIQQWLGIGKAQQIVDLSGKVWRIRAYGDFLSYMYVAEGIIDAASEPDLKIHDIAALVPIVREAGGQFTALDGELSDKTSVVLATNGHLHEQMRSALS
jgi:histidinol-phosphatase